jgi:hypothetical protein
MSNPPDMGADQDKRFSFSDLDEFLRRADPEQRQPCHAYAEDVPRLVAEVVRLREGLIRLVHGDYDSGWDPEGYADALLNDEELADEPWSIEDPRRYFTSINREEP